MYEWMNVCLCTCIHIYISMYTLCIYIYMWLYMDHMDVYIVCVYQLLHARLSWMRICTGQEYYSITSFEFYWDESHSPSKSIMHISLSKILEKPCFPKKIGWLHYEAFMVDCNSCRRVNPHVGFLNLHFGWSNPVFFFFKLTYPFIIYVYIYNVVSWLVAKFAIVPKTLYHSTLSVS